MTQKNEALGLLTAEQKEIVARWLEEGKSLRVAADDIGKAPPDGFGIPVSHSAVQRFKADLKKEKLREEMAEQEAMAMELLQAANHGTVDFRSATVQVLQRKVFSAAAEAKGDAACEMLRKLVEMEQRQQRIELANKNFQLSQARFEINTSRELMKKAKAYIEVYQEQAVDDEVKVRKAREICFGSGPEGGVVEKDEG